MPRNHTLIQQRNAFIKVRFRYHRTQNPKWNIEYVLEAVAKDVFLSPVTVTKILKHYDEPIPDHSTISRKIN